MVDAPPSLKRIIEEDDRAAFESILDNEPGLLHPMVTIFKDGAPIPLWAELIQKDRNEWLKGMVERMRQHDSIFQMGASRALHIYRHAGDQPSIAALDILTEAVNDPQAFAEAVAQLATQRACSSARRHPAYADQVAHWAFQHQATLEGSPLVTKPRDTDLKGTPAPSSLTYLLSLKYLPKSKAVTAWVQGRSATASLETLDTAIAAAGKAWKVDTFKTLIAVRKGRPDADQPFTASGEGQPDLFAEIVIAAGYKQNRSPSKMTAMLQAWADYPIGCQARDANGRSVLDKVLNGRRQWLEVVVNPIANNNNPTTIALTQQKRNQDFMEEAVVFLLQQNANLLEPVIPSTGGANPPSMLEMVQALAPKAYAMWQEETLENALAAPEVPASPSSFSKRARL